MARTGWMKLTRKYVERLDHENRSGEIAMGSSPRVDGGRRALRAAANRHMRMKGSNLHRYSNGKQGVVDLLSQLIKLRVA